MLQPKLQVLPTAKAVAEAAAEHVVRAAELAIQRRDAFTIALAGGSTPKLLYELLASDAWAKKIAWGRVEVYFGDERTVPPDHKESNFRMASEALLDVVPIPPQNIHRMRGEVDPEAAAIEYGEMLKARFGDGGVDLALLGMGEDGHTASLFPVTEALNEKKHRCVANHVPQLNTWRITMTAPFLNRSGEVLFLITGGSKANRIKEVLEGDSDPKRLPIQLIHPESGSMIWYLDAPAAGMTA